MEFLKSNQIDVHFDFTTDTPYYWDGFWNHKCGLGSGKNDPDIKSKTLQRYHQLLWSRLLPNGQFLDLTAGTGKNYLTGNDFRFGSDSITASFRYKRYSFMLEQVQQVVPDYRTFVENYLRKMYTIGGMIIFPKRPGVINQSRGINPFTKDRWDLTRECIRRYYNHETSPLYDALLRDKKFLTFLSILKVM